MTESEFALGDVRRRLGVQGDEPLGYLSDWRRWHPDGVPGGVVSECGVCDAQHGE